MLQNRDRSTSRANATAALLCLEAVVTVGALVLFGVAFPDRFRSRLWTNGGENGWCSNPRLRIYFYANYEDPPEIPLIWSQSLTTSSMATAVLGTSVFFARMTMAALRYEARGMNILYDAALSILWACSAVAQNGPDLSDSEHVSARPWYLERDCDDAWAANRGWCRIAKWEYAWAVLAALFYGAKMVGILGWSLYEKGKKDGRTEDFDIRVWNRDSTGNWAVSYKHDIGGTRA
ncbi:hypothetical protein CCHL11_02163 [Colletotrichum chlorophyti]|uniref:MARVEL domain-containing protein n=1 Tax=Colletotrichum chlorophyti TaxID=708187 RepID=A0A1Q8S6R9_9PEZI|nr:hypothetical protein CCHL11_02163 [Colletotrichum chlorophyti]